MEQQERLHPLRSCHLCPRHCGIDRLGGEKGMCGLSHTLKVSRVGLHFWEEPCISGTVGSGTVFFSGCNLRCVFCQNQQISRGDVGRTYTVSELAAAFLDLQRQGAQNINLVTATHVVPQVAAALKEAKVAGLTLPIVYNCGGYEGEAGLALLSGLVDVYLPDFKYDDPVLAQKYSSAKDYPLQVRRGIKEMFAQVGEFTQGENGELRRGVLVRHLVLPGQTRQAKRILSYLHRVYGEKIGVSILRQYTPMPGVPQELQRPVYDAEYDSVVSHARSLGMERVYLQEKDSVGTEYIPKFETETE